jgi:hypothetical protein
VGTALGRVLLEKQYATAALMFCAAAAMIEKRTRVCFRKGTNATFHLDEQGVICAAPCERLAAHGLAGRAA